MGDTGNEGGPCLPKTPPKCLTIDLTEVFDYLSEAVTVLDASGNVLFVNRAGRELAGLSADTWNVRDEDSNCLLYPDGQPVPQEDRPGVRVLAGKPVKDLELVILRPDGGQRRVVYNGSLIDASGTTVAALTCRDVTEERRLAEARKDLVRTMSHDLLNSLTLISAQAQIMRRSLQAKGLSHEALGADVITKASLRMSRLINGLVNWTRADLRGESSPAVDEGVPIDLIAVAKALAERLNMVEIKPRIYVDCPERLPKVFGELPKIEQILENLLSNALKYSPSHSPVVVSLTSDDRWITVAVKDEGVGIAPDELPRLFDRFYRASSGVGTEGIGLGLYIAKGAVLGLGGKIWAESVVGQGSTFYFSLPAHKENPMN
ncbi:MAG: ATP-binding protein [Bacillota bacterium]|jgi:PAS domain S-box-containing protein